MIANKLWPRLDRAKFEASWEVHDISHVKLREHNLVFSDYKDGKNAPATRREGYSPDSNTPQAEEDVCAVEGLAVTKTKNPIIHDELPQNFFNNELVILATGTNEEVLEISHEYGVLTSPIDADIQADKYRILQNHQLQESPDYPHVDMHSIVEIPNISSESYCGLRDCGYLFALQDAWEETFELRTHYAKNTDNHIDSVSLREIRETAKMLLRVVTFAQLHTDNATIDSIGSKLKDDYEYANGDSKDVYGYAYRVNRLFLSLCLRNCTLSFNAAVFDSSTADANRIDQEVITSNASTSSKRYGTLTEAVALQIFNTIIDPRSWKTCANCHDVFKVRNKVVIKRKTTKQIGTPSKPPNDSSPNPVFCSSGCKVAAHQRKHRKKVKRAKELYANGISIEQIANKLGSKPETIKKWIEEGTKKKGAS